jgi:hypothetical protein
MIFKRDEVLKDLREFVAEVSFTKVDGQNRVMRCTLKPDLLPAKYINEEIEAEKSFHAENTDVIRAWDVQKAGWRSFRMDSVIYFQVIDAY